MLRIETLGHFCLGFVLSSCKVSPASLTDLYSLSSEEVRPQPGSSTNIKSEMCSFISTLVSKPCLTQVKHKTATLLYIYSLISSKLVLWNLAWAESRHLGERRSFPVLWVESFFRSTWWKINSTENATIPKNFLHRKKIK